MTPVRPRNMSAVGFYTFSAGRPVSARRLVMVKPKVLGGKELSRTAHSSLDCLLSV